MKKLILFSLLALSLQLSSAQNTEKGRIKKNEIEKCILNSKLLKAHQSFPVNSLNQPINNRLYKKANKQKLDNLIFEIWDGSAFSPDNKEEFVYDGSGNVIIDLSSSWDDVANKWVNEYKTDYTRDSKGNITVETGSEWDTTINNLKITSKTINTYDSKNNLTSSIYSYFDDVLNKMVNMVMNEYTYDSKNNITTSIFSTWDSDFDKFIFSGKYEDTYNADNKVLTELGFSWNTTTSLWDPGSKDEYDYDSKGNLLQDIYYFWDESLSKLVLSNKTENTYDGNNKNLTSISSMYDPDLMIWIPYFKDQFTYDANGNVLTTISSDWNDLKSKFVNSEQTENTYDSKDNITSETYSSWNEAKNKWVASDKTEYLRDLAVASDQLVLPFDQGTIDEYIKYKLTQILQYTWDKASSKFELDGKGTLNYSDFVSSGINEVASTSTLILFPNPATDNVSINFPNHSGNLEVKIFDITGKSVLVENINSKGSINVSGLCKGIYFVQVFEGINLVGNRKLVKE